jgi:hypothetical protein
MRKCKLACNFRVEQKIMNVLFVHDIYIIVLGGKKDEL